MDVAGRVRHDAAGGAGAGSSSYRADRPFRPKFRELVRTVTCAAARSPVAASRIRATAGVAPEPRSRTVRLSNRKVTGRFVVVLDRVARSPMLPACWRAAVESVALNVQVVGSLLPTAQARPRIVVGLVPITWKRTLTAVPGTRTRPLATSAPRAVSAEPL